MVKSCCNVVGVAAVLVAGRATVRAAEGHKASAVKTTQELMASVQSLRNKLETQPAHDIFKKAEQSVKGTSIPQAKPTYPKPSVSSLRRGVETQPAHDILKKTEQTYAKPSVLPAYPEDAGQTRLYKEPKTQDQNNNYQLELKSKSKKKSKSTGSGCSCSSSKKNKLKSSGVHSHTDTDIVVNPSNPTSAPLKTTTLASNSTNTTAGDF